MQFRTFADRVEEIEAEPADLEVVSLLADLLADAGDDLPVVVRFVQGRVFPGWDARKLDVGPALCYEALARAAGPNVTADDIEDRLAREGEIGAVAAGLDLGGQQGLAAFGAGGQDPLTVAGVADELRKVAEAEGAGSEDRKRTALFGLFSRAQPAEAKYIARLVLGEMRVGVGGGTVRDAIAEAFDVPVEAVARALQVTNDYGRVAVLARDEGESGLADVHLAVGRPVQAMLAQAGTVADALEDWDEAAVEAKFDGARVQIHHDPAGIPSASGGGSSDPDIADDDAGDAEDADEADDPGDADDADDRESPDADGDNPTVRLYSRNMEDVTDPLPEIREYVEERLDQAAILDGEVVAVDDHGDPLPFQEVLRRFRRKYDVERMRDEVELELHAFDCLQVAGEDLLDSPFRERHDRLEALLPEAASEVLYTTDAERIETFEADVLEAGHEGVMLKNPASAYTPGDRGKNWLKRKPDVETLDLVVTGAEWGEGRRATFLGTYELSVRAGGDGEASYETVGKVATGITDEELAELTDLLEPEIVSEDGQTVDVRPAVVFEVGYEEIQRSPTYSSGYALRFPRFLGVRDDKDPADADTLERVERLANGD